MTNDLLSFQTSKLFRFAEEGMIVSETIVINNLLHSN